jgi:DNA-binding HxlR family transcriptional regulator
MALLDLLGHRWSLGIIWILAERGPLSFSALQSGCEAISPGVLNTRLKELTLAKFVQRTNGTYSLTSIGEELFALIEPLGQWARETWAVTVTH